ncbi:MAG: rubrerythrin family protein [Ruminococcus sp.]|nr:rubrerythrin family protein [Ruminococcus sp.]
MELKNSTTLENLMRAWAGETQACSRYRMSAERMRQQKLFSLARLFDFTADQEQKHAEVFFSLMQGGGSGKQTIEADYPSALPEDAAELLQAACNREQEEAESIYPAFAAKARDEGFKQIAQTFESIADIERSHGARFVYYAELAREFRLYSEKDSTLWVCLNCGYVFEGETAPEQCPVCSQPQGHYVRADELCAGIL